MGNNTLDFSDSAGPKGEAKPSLAPKILIIEDDPSLRSMYTQKFELEGFVVFSASNGKDGLEIALDKEVDVVLLDILLPKMKGTEVLAALRQDGRGKDILVIVYSNLADPVERDRALHYGASEYLEKALNTPENIVEKVKKHLKL